MDCVWMGSVSERMGWVRTCLNTKQKPFQTGKPKLEADKRQLYPLLDNF